MHLEVQMNLYYDAMINQMKETYHFMHKLYIHSGLYFTESREMCNNTVLRIMSVS